MHWVMDSESYDIITKLRKEENKGWVEIKEIIGYPNKSASLSRSYQIFGEKTKGNVIKPKESLRKELSDLNIEIEFLESECKLIDEVIAARKRVAELKKHLDDFRSGSEPKMPTMVMPSENAKPSNESETHHNVTAPPKTDLKKISDTKHDGKRKATPRNEFYEPKLPENVTEESAESILEMIIEGKNQEDILKHFDISEDDFFRTEEWLEEYR